jgi:hypothetical protein
MAAHFEHTVAVTGDGYEVLTLPADYPWFVCSAGGSEGAKVERDWLSARRTFFYYQIEEIFNL